MLCYEPLGNRHTAHVLRQNRFHHSHFSSASHDPHKRSSKAVSEGALHPLTRRPYTVDPWNRRARLSPGRKSDQFPIPALTVAIQYILFGRGKRSGVRWSRALARFGGVRLKSTDYTTPPCI